MIRRPPRSTRTDTRLPYTTLFRAHHAHPERSDITVAEALEMERPALQPILAPFDGFHESEHAVTGTCLISFDRNRYSVMSTAARRTVQVRSYVDRIVIRCGEDRKSVV